MALKFFYMKFNGVSGVFYKNNSNSYVLILNMAVGVTGMPVIVSVQDPESVTVINILNLIAFSESLSVSGSNTFSITTLLYFHTLSHRKPRNSSKESA